MASLATAPLVYNLSAGGVCSVVAVAAVATLLPAAGVTHMIPIKQLMGHNFADPRPGHSAVVGGGRGQDIMAFIFILQHPPALSYTHSVLSQNMYIHNMYVSLIIFILHLRYKKILILGGVPTELKKTLIWDKKSLGLGIVFQGLDLPTPSKSRHLQTK